jgi:N-acetylmuramate 1-kinase
MMHRDILRSDWLTQTLNAQGLSAQHIVHTEALPGDASFRRYFRIHTTQQTYLLMDAPPDLENSASFVQIATLYQMQAIRTPRIFAQDLAQGFLLLEDFGTQLLADVLHSDNASFWYQRCYQELPKIQRCLYTTEQPLTVFVNELLENELEQFKNWVLVQFANINFSTAEQHAWQECVQQIKTVCAQQPQVGVHRDYHSRNLMILPKQTIGIIDFQDALIGPLTYDLVSLLRDCYVDWPKAQVDTWRDDYYSVFADHNAYSREQFEYWFDWQGLQRHLKALFIFCRKYLRDGSTNYLSAIPRTFQYALNETAPYPGLAWLHLFLTERLAEPLFNRIKVAID